MRSKLNKLGEWVGALVGVALVLCAVALVIAATYKLIVWLV